MVKEIKETPPTMEIQLVQMAAWDMGREEMAKDIGCSLDALSKRMDRIREKYECRTVAALCYLFMKHKFIK